MNDPRREAAELEIQDLLCQEARESFLSFVSFTKPDYHVGWFHRKLADRLQKFVQAVERQESPRLMLFVPPQHGKSEQVSRRLPPWIFGLHPDWYFISASYNTRLARKFGRDVRSIIESPHYRDIFAYTRIGQIHSEDDRRGSHAADELTFTDGGSYLAVGLGGMTTGLPAHIFSIDDPVKGMAEAESELGQEARLDWYMTTSQTRLKRGGGVLLTTTRWDDKDLAGDLLRIAQKDPNADQWEVIRFPAIAMEDEEDRKAGEALCEHLHPIHELRRTRATMIAAGKSHQWNCLYQQNPIPDDGVFYLQTDFRTYKTVPKHGRRYITSDLAQSKKRGADWTVLLPADVSPDDDIHILPGMIRKRMDALETACRLLILANQINAQFITLPNDHMGNAIKPFLLKLMDGATGEDAVVLFAGTSQEEVLEIPRRWYTLEMMSVSQDKMARSASFQARQRQGKVFWPDVPWFHEIVKPEMLAFPAGAHDDVADACADLGRLLTKLDKGRKPKDEKPSVPKPARWAEVDKRQKPAPATIPDLFDASTPNALFGASNE